MPSSALGRLIELQHRGSSLFQTDRNPDTQDFVYPSVAPTSLDPRRHRGYWVPKVGFLLLPPLVRDVFASAWAALTLVLLQAEDGARCFHVDPFEDGTVALTLGEGPSNRGVYQDTLALLRTGRANTPLPYFINVLPRNMFPEDLQGEAGYGTFCCTERVSILERIQLHVSDAREVAAILGGSVPFIDSATGLSNPFDGPFRAGGQLQFHALSGERIARHRVPKHRDRVEAMARAEARRFRLHSSAGPGGGVGSAEPQSGTATSGPLARALRLIEECATRTIAVDELASVSRMSVSHFHVLFRRSLGCPPATYVMNRRLDIAEKLLADTQIPISEIAQRCGFSEQASLTRSLRTKRGITPARLRRMAQSNPQERGS